MFNRIDTLILAGGLGSRLSSVVADRPKSMAEIEGRPFLEIILSNLRKEGFSRFIVCTGIKSYFIEKYYKKDSEVIISKETRPLGTAGALKQAENFIDSDFFLVLNGDSFCPVKLEDLINFHITKKAEVSIVLAEVEQTNGFGSIKTNDEGEIYKFTEKEDRGKGFVNAGIYVCSRELLSLIPKNQKISLEYEIFPKMLQYGKIFGYKTDKKFIDIGTPESYQNAGAFLKAFG